MRAKGWGRGPDMLGQRRRHDGDTVTTRRRHGGYTAARGGLLGMARLPLCRPPQLAEPAILVILDRGLGQLQVLGRESAWPVSSVS